MGIYGVMAFGVAQRTQEFGVRLALGAQLVGRAMQSTLYGVGAMDKVAVGWTAVMLLAVALIACLIPALRASRVEPMVALRDQ